MRERILTATLRKNTWVSGGEKWDARGQKRDSAGIYSPGFIFVSRNPPLTRSFMRSIFVIVLVLFIFFSFVILLSTSFALDVVDRAGGGGGEKAHVAQIADRDHVLICIYIVEHCNNNGIFHHPTSVNTYTHTYTHITYYYIHTYG